MNIPARITARKVVYSYIYGYILRNNPFGNKTWDISLVDKTGLPDNDLVVIQDDFSEDEVLDYCVRIVENFFSFRQKPEVDIAYIKKMIVGIAESLKVIAKKVNEYTDTFSFEKMDVSDQTLFVLALTELTQVGSPKEVIINEMVELGKRYGDKGSPKLVNGVLHKMLSVEELKINPGKEVKEKSQ